jgi:hypothetical protein
VQGKKYKSKCENSGGQIVTSCMAETMSFSTGELGVQVGLTMFYFMS